jgi:hypothetical protein
MMAMERDFGLLPKVGGWFSELAAMAVGLFERMLRVAVTPAPLLLPSSDSREDCEPPNPKTKKWASQEIRGYVSMIMENRREDEPLNTKQIVIR